MHERAAGKRARKSKGKRVSEFGSQIATVELPPFAILRCMCVVRTSYAELPVQFATLRAVIYIMRVMN